MWMAATAQRERGVERRSPAVRLALRVVQVTRRTTRTHPGRDRHRGGLQPGNGRWWLQRAAKWWTRWWWLRKNGTRRVRITNTIRVCVANDSANDPERNSGAAALKTQSMTAAMPKSKTELMGPKRTMERRMRAMSQAPAADPTQFGNRRPTPPKLPTVSWVNDPSREALIQNKSRDRVSNCLTGSAFSRSAAAVAVEAAAVLLGGAAGAGVAGGRRRHW